MVTSCFIFVISTCITSGIYSYMYLFIFMIVAMLTFNVTQVNISFRRSRLWWTWLCSQHKTSSGKETYIWMLLEWETHSLHYHWRVSRRLLLSYLIQCIWKKRNKFNLCSICVGWCFKMEVYFVDLNGALSQKRVKILR